MTNRLSENTGYIESADDFYGKQNFQLEHTDEFNKMGALYNKRLNQILSKNYEDISGQRAGERLLKKVIRDKNKIQFGNYLKYLVYSGKLDSKNNFDDIDQIGDLQDKLKNLKEQSESLGPKDFNILKGRIGNYIFKGKDHFEYLGNNFYKIKIDFSKIKQGYKSKYFSFIREYKKGNEFIIKYAGKDKIEYYQGNSLENKIFLGSSIIDHKNEKVTKRKNRNEIIEYTRGAEHNVYLEKFNMHLTLKFNNK